MVDIEKELIKEAKLEHDDILDAVAACLKGDKYAGKYRRLTFCDAKSLLIFYKKIFSDKSFSKLDAFESFDTDIREDFLSDKVYALLEEWHEKAGD